MLASMEFSAQQLAELLQGTVEGAADVTVNALSKIEEGQPQSISFLGNPAYAEHIYDSDASIVIVNNDFVLERPVKPTLTLIRVPDARMAFAKLLEAYNTMRHNKTGVADTASVDSSATIGEHAYIGAGTVVAEQVSIGNNVKIYPNCFIGANAQIGDNVLIHPGVQVMHDSVIGNNCTLMPGVVLGGDGFGFQPNSSNNYQKVVHIGNVVLEDHVEVGANTSIDRATLGSTIIRKGVKLDNLIQVAHNVEIGENTVIAAQTGVAGSTTIGRNCMIGGQVGIVGHLTIGDNVKIAAQSGIGSNIEDNAIVQGSPAFSIGDYKRSYVLFRSLPALKVKIDKLLAGLTEAK